MNHYSIVLMVRMFLLAHKDRVDYWRKTLQTAVRQRCNHLLELLNSICRSV